MQIKKSNEINTSSQTIETQNSTIEKKPGVSVGISSIPDSFESASSKSSNGKTNSTPSAHQRFEVSQQPNLKDTLFNSFRQSISESNEDKKDYLENLQEQNQTANELSEYLEELTNQSQDLQENSKGSEHSEPKPIAATNQNADLLEAVARRNSESNDLGSIRKTSKKEERH